MAYNLYFICSKDLFPVTMYTSKSLPLLFKKKKIFYQSHRLTIRGVRMKRFYVWFLCKSLFTNWIRFEFSIFWGNNGSHEAYIYQYTTKYETILCYSNVNIYYFNSWELFLLFYVGTNPLSHTTSNIELYWKQMILKIKWNKDMWW